MASPRHRAAGDSHPSSSQDAVVSIDGVSKRFGHVQALDGFDLEVARGEVHGFLGPNGAGKSTTLRLLLGLLRRDAGSLRVFGADPWSQALEVHSRVAYVPSDVSLWPGLSGGQCIDVLGAAHGGLLPHRRQELIDHFDLDPTRRARDYSTGNRQKVLLIAALATDADLLVLDEPTAGLDPLMERAFQDCIRQRRNEGTTVLLSSHILGEVEALADRVSIIRRGQRVSSGTLADLRRHTRTSVHAVTSQPPAGLDSADGVESLRIEEVEHGHDLRFTVTSQGLDEAVGLLHHAGITTLTMRPPSLDDLFLSWYGQEEA